MNRICLPILNVGIRQNEGYNDEYQAVYDAMTNKPSSPVASAQNAMVASLISAGVWEYLDLFFLLAQESNGDSEAQINWVNPGTYDLAANNSPTFTSLEGFTGNGTNSYLKSVFVPSTNGSNFTGAVGAWGVYCRSAFPATANKYAFGTRRNNLFTGTNPATQIKMQMWSNAIADVSSAPSAAMYIGTTETSPTANYRSLYKNASSIFNALTTPQATDDYPLMLLGRGGAVTPGSYTVIQLSCFFAGAAMDQTKVTAVTNAIEAYMDSNSKGIIT